MNIKFPAFLYLQTSAINHSSKCRLNDGFFEGIQESTRIQLQKQFACGRNWRVGLNHKEILWQAAEVPVTSIAKTSLNPHFLRPLNFLFYLEPIFDFSKTVHLINYVHVECTNKFPGTKCYLQPNRQAPHEGTFRCCQENTNFRSSQHLFMLLSPHHLSFN